MIVSSILNVIVSIGLCISVVLNAVLAKHLHELAKALCDLASSRPSVSLHFVQEQDATEAQEGTLQ